MQCDLAISFVSLSGSNSFRSRLMFYCRCFSFLIPIARSRRCISRLAWNFPRWSDL